MSLQEKKQDLRSKLIRKQARTLNSTVKKTKKKHWPKEQNTILKTSRKGLNKNIRSTDSTKPKDTPTEYHTNRKYLN